MGITIWRLYTGKLPLTHPNPSIFTNLQLTHPIQDHVELPSKIYGVLAKMCFKHSFKTAPNKMELSKVREALINAQNMRYQRMSDVREDLLAIKEKKWWK